MRVYITEVMRDGHPYAGPEIVADSWEEAEQQTGEGVRVIGYKEVEAEAGADGAARVAGE